MTLSVPTPTARRRGVAYALGGFGMAVNAMVQFLLPLRAVELGIGIAAVGLLLGVKGVVETFASVPIGSLIDRIGARRAIVLGAGATAALGLVYAAATSLLVLALAQVALGLVRPLGWVGSQAYVSGMRRGKDKAADTGRFSFFANGGQIVAPLLVGVAAQYQGLAAGFVVLAGYCAIFSLLAVFLPRDERAAGSSAESARGGFGDAVMMLRDRPMRAAMLLTFTRLWIPSCWTAFFPLILVTNGMPESAAASTVSVMSLTAMVLGLFVGRLARWGRDFVVTAVALAAGCGGLVVAPFVASLPAAYLSSLMVGIGQGVSLPMLIVLVRTAAPPGQEATALGLRSSVNQTAAAVAPAVIAFLLGATAATIGFPVAGAVGLLSLGAASLTDRRAALDTAEYVE